MKGQARGEETRLRILDAAQRSFARKGYDATSVAEICKSAGVTKGAFYHHFSSKQAVFVELLDRWLTGLDAQMEAVRAATDTVPQRLLNMARMSHVVFQQAGGQLPIFLEFWTKASRDPATWKATISFYHRYQGYFSGLVDEGIAEGSLRPVVSSTAATGILSLAVGLVLQGLLDPHGSDWGQVAEDSIRLLLQGLQSPASSIERVPVT